MKMMQTITAAFCVTLAFCATVTARDAEPKQSVLITGDGNNQEEAMTRAIAESLK